MKKGKIMKFTQKNSPAILIGFGILSFLSGTVWAVKNTPKAVRLLEQKEEEKGSKLLKKEIIKTTWKCYVPTAISSTIGVVCVISAHKIHNKRNMILASAYAISEASLKEYQNKVVEKIGKKKEEEIRSEIDKDKLTKNPIKEEKVIQTHAGNTLCYDAISGRYFRSDIEYVKKAVNIVNRMMMDDGYVSLNDFYYEVGLDNIMIGDEMGWNLKNELIDYNFTSHLSADGQPCLVIGFRQMPTLGYQK